ncbi:GNAT family N-acetyltransferase [Pseudomarimonas salicorniae]|uniref:GNAT family N-acetyltransferase n=1 Tax=Pseudomarimonas salicorniae TaxID=2933270 RepID=A0ABT0GIC1_9GAMM|nr:GNAT family N-acetyltransferase [Lysobacter sp. CAU 1642]MCK7594295.1 GNAT family N-acetyltransferase [Lysobacter sp. CAU 1642]
MSIEIRRASPPDLDALAPMFDAYRQFYEQRADAARARGFIAARLEAADSVILLALIDGRPAGFAQLFPSFSSVRTGLLWILNDLYVAGDCRQRGVGRALLSACVAHGEQTGAVGLQLETQRTNNVAQALYVEQGWEMDEEFCSFHYPLENHR